MFLISTPFYWKEINCTFLIWFWSYFHLAWRYGKCEVTITLSCFSLIIYSWSESYCLIYNKDLMLFWFVCALKCLLPKNMLQHLTEQWYVKLSPSNLKRYPDCFFFSFPAFCYALGETVLPCWKLHSAHHCASSVQSNLCNETSESLFWMNEPFRKCMIQRWFYFLSVIIGSGFHESVTVFLISLVNKVF